MTGRTLKQSIMAGLSAVLFMQAGASAGALKERVVIVADTPQITRWAAVHVEPDPANGDPYFHVEVFEHRKGAKPWAFTRLSQHMPITAKALEKSRIASRARTYAYKDVEFRIVYRHWRDDAQARAQTPVCRTTIDDCLKD